MAIDDRRRSRRRGLLFYRRVEWAVEVGPAPYREMIGDHEIWWVLE